MALNLAQIKELHAAGKLIGLHDVEELAYHAGPGVSQSTLKAFKLSPAHGKAQMDKHSEPTAAMKLGTAVHCAVLEPKRFDSLYVGAPDIKRNSNAGKEAYAAWASENVGKEIIDGDDLALVKKMREAVRAHEVAATLTTGVIEQAAYWIDETTGLLCKCKPDAIVFEQGVILDLKTTNDDATEKAFGKAVGNYGYHIQAAFYLDGVKEALKQSSVVDSRSVGLQSTPERFVFLVVEKSAPHGVALFELDFSDLCIGREAYKKYLQELAICQMENYWPSYRQGIQTIKIPTWAL